MALSADFKQHGREAIEAVRKCDPSTYMRVVAGLLPAKVDLDLHRAQEQPPQRTLEQVQADIQAAIEERAQALVDQRSTLAVQEKPDSDGGRVE